jgi:5-methylcytosine-specific restriction endonuclease McrA
MTLIQKQKKAERAKRYRERHPERVKQQERSWRLRNKARLNEAHRRWRFKNKDRVKLHEKTKYMKHKDKIQRRATLYNSTHKDRHNAVSRAYYERNKEREQERSRTYRKLNPEKIAALTANRRARVREAPGKWTHEDIVEQYFIQNGRCLYCCVPIAKGEFQTDHIVALVNGGTNARSNLALACVRCNQTKQTQSALNHVLRLVS